MSFYQLIRYLKDILPFNNLFEYLIFIFLKVLYNQKLIKIYILLELLMNCLQIVYFLVEYELFDLLMRLCLRKDA